MTLTQPWGSWWEELLSEIMQVKAPEAKKVFLGGRSVPGREPQGRVGTQELG